MSFTQLLQNSKIIGSSVAGLLNGNGYSFSTPIGGNMIPDATLTKGQKLFSTNATNPNLPKPKTLFFVYFNLNPDLSSKIQYKQQLVKELSGKEIDGSSINSMGEKQSTVNSMINSAISKMGLGKAMKLLDKVEKESNSQSLQRETVADFIPDKELFLKLSYEISKMVKSYNKPSVTFKTSELNEYNRKRIIYDGVDYDDVTITFFDVKDNPVQQFFNAYLKFICGDFLCKDHNLWEAPIDNNHWQNVEGYKTVDSININGTYTNNLNSFGLNIDSNFKLIQSISFCEYYMDRMMVYTIENPSITSIKWGDGTMGDFSANDIQITFKYEGITNDLVDIHPYNVNWTKNIGSDIAYTRYMVNKEIKKDVATFLQTKYSTTTMNIVSDITSIIKGYMNGDQKFSWNRLKNQALDTARKYGMANEANTVAQVEQSIKTFNSKEGSNKTKYLVNVATDPTSVIGKVSGANSQARGNVIL